MKRIAFFDAKPYDRESFDRANTQYDIHYFEDKLNPETARLAAGFDAACAFVNDDIGTATVRNLIDEGVGVLAMRCAGYSNVDFEAAEGRLTVVRVPAYSPHAVAEHAMGMLLTVNRRLHKAYIRTREFNFNISGLTGVDFHGKTAGVIGTGKIGRAFIDLCRGFGMRVIAHDPYPVEGIDYVPLEVLLAQSDVISLHCPLTNQSYHLLDETAFERMKRGVFLINTSRGALIDSTALLKALNDGTVRGAGLDVYEEETEYFYEDRSIEPIRDDVLSLLVSKPNVLITSHQAFLTEEALANIAETTLRNLDEYFSGQELTNEVRYHRETGKVVEDPRRLRRDPQPVNA